MTSTSRGPLEAIRSTFEGLDAHRGFWADNSQAYPAVGSPLADDDKIWPRLSLSQLARAGLACAWDHLDLVRLTIEQQRIFVTATNSVIRGALLAASQALWALGPDEPIVRQQRGLTLADEWYRRRQEWQESMTIAGRQGAVILPTDILSADDVGRSAHLLETLAADQKQVTALRTTKGTLNATQCVRVAADTAADRTGKPQLAASAIREWRRLGGDAHGLGWPLMTQDITWGRRGPDGLTEANVTADLETVANGYLCAWLIYESGFIRLRELSNRAE